MTALYKFPEPPSSVLALLSLFVMNFTGQFRKSRNINLGGRNSGTTSRESILRKAQADRLRREQARKEEKAAIKIQSYYRGKRDLYSQRIVVAHDWKSHYVGQNRTYSADEFLRCLQEFNFSLKFLVNQQEFGQFIYYLYGIIQENEPILKDKIDLHVNYFIENLQINLLESTVNLDEDAPLTNILQIILILSKYTDLGSPVRFVSLLSRIIQRLPGTNSPVNSLIASIIQPLYQSHPQLIIYEILSVPNVLSIIPAETFSSTASLPSPQGLSLPSHLDSNRKIWMLSNSLSSIINLDHLSLSNVELLTSLLHTLDVNIVERVEFDYSDSENSVKNSQMKRTKIFSFSSNQPPLPIHLINKLYERDFTTNLFSLIGLNTSPTSINLMATLYVYLIKLFPKRRKDLMLYLTLAKLQPATPSTSPTSAVHVFWQSFKLSDCYLKTVSAATLSHTDLLLLSSEYTSWTKLILTFELYSYWLIVADDTEFWQNEEQGISFAELKNMSLFLKNLCFQLIWNWPKIESESIISNETHQQFKKLKDLSLSLIRQIYIRDSRRQFFGNDFWLMKNNIIDMEHFIPAVVEEEERQQEASNNALSDSEGEEDESLPKRNNNIMKVIAPRLEILKQVPFFMPFNDRVHVFQAFIELDRVRSQGSSLSNMIDIFGNMPRIKAEIRREHLLQDAYKAFSTAGSSFKFPIGVTFLSQGMPESGIDGGGLTKEFLTSVCKEGFYENSLDLFKTTNDHLLYPNPVMGVTRRLSNLSDEEIEKSLSYIEFLGQVIGKCLYSEILVDVEFAPFFLLKWAGKASKNSFDDLYSLDPVIYDNLVKVHKYPGNVEDDLNLNFVTIQDVGRDIQRSIELRPNGEDIPVTNTNRLEYIHSIANYKLNSVLAPQTNRFLRGMSKVISLNWLSMFNAKELQMLISGGNSKINIDDLAANTVYGGYSEHDKTVECFWQVVRDLPEEDKRDFIKFVTSVPKAPLLGFSQLNPKFSIRNAGSDKSRLPTSSTCVNLLKLPNYGDKRLLKDKLLYAIRAGAGFDLS